MNSEGRKMVQNLNNTVSVYKVCCVVPCNVSFKKQGGMFEKQVTN
jgi:hypothetical protein